MGEDGEEAPDGEPARDGFGLDEDEIVGKGPETEGKRGCDTGEPAFFCEELGGKQLEGGKLAGWAGLSELVEADELEIGDCAEEEESGFDGAKGDAGEGEGGMSLFEDGVEGEGDADTGDGHEEDAESGEEERGDLRLGEGEEGCAGDGFGEEDAEHSAEEGDQEEDAGGETVFSIYFHCLPFFMLSVLGWIGLIELEDLLDGGVEGEGDAKGELEGGVVFAFFEGEDGLAGGPGFFGELLLGHFIILKT